MGIAIGYFAPDSEAAIVAAQAKALPEAATLTRRQQENALS
jgi:hypothetical protein